MKKITTLKVKLEKFSISLDNLVKKIKGSSDQKILFSSVGLTDTRRTKWKTMSNKRTNWEKISIYEVSCP